MSKDQPIICAYDGKCIVVKVPISLFGDDCKVDDELAEAIVKRTCTILLESFEEEFVQRVLGDVEDGDA